MSVSVSDYLALCLAPISDMGDMGDGGIDREVPVLAVHVVGARPAQTA